MTTAWWKRSKSKKGFLAMEIMVALSVFFISALSLNILSSNASILSNYGIEYLRATLFAKEGLEAVRSIRDFNFDNLIDGAHGLSLISNLWALYGTSDSQGPLQRQIIISAVDNRTKKINSVVTGPLTNITLTTYLTDWRQSQGQAACFNIDLSSVILEEGNKTLRNFIFNNNCLESIMIDRVTGWWNGTSLIQELKIGDFIWRHNGPGTPSGKQPSGVELDVVDLIMTPEYTEADTWIKFNGPTGATDFVIQFKMIDGSIKSILIDK